jgi:hypothetical protein
VRQTARGFVRRSGDKVQLVEVGTRYRGPAKASLRVASFSARTLTSVCAREGAAEERKSSTGAGLRGAGASVDSDALSARSAGRESRHARRHSQRQRGSQRSSALSCRA